MPVVVSPGNTLFPNVHTFVGGPESPDDGTRTCVRLGDVVLRAKYSLLKGDVIDVSGAFLTTLATGNHQDFLGSGATTLRPFLVLSRTLFDVLTPHLNIGYEFNLDRGHQSACTVPWLRCRHPHLDGRDLCEPADGIGDHILMAR